MRRLPFLVLAAALAFAGVAQARPRACPPGLHKAMTAELYFGLSTPDTGEVTDAEWRRFVDQDVTPRFPEGLSVSDVYGQWRSPAGQFVHENSKMVFVVLSGAADEPARLDSIRDAYKKRFEQQSVLLVEQPACVAF